MANSILQRTTDILSGQASFLKKTLSVSRVHGCTRLNSGMG